MTYFPDLSPYAYGHQSQPGVVHVGWLDNVHPFPKGTVDTWLIQKMRVLASRPVELYRGKHRCELCVEPPGLVKTYNRHGIVIDPNCSWARWLDGCSGNGEIRVSRGEIVFAAPVLVVHNIEVHSYLPPDEFLQAVADAPN